MRYLLATALLLSSLAYAGDVTLTWTPPTQNTDGSELTDLAGYRIYYGTASASYTQTIEVANPGATSLVVEGLAEGTYYFAATAINASGIESDYSNEAAKVVEPPPTTPAPPSGLAVLADNLTAYALSMTDDVLRLYPIGTVPPGTPCDGSMSANGKHLVPASAVNYETTQRPRVVVAECG